MFSQQQVFNESSTRRACSKEFHVPWLACWAWAGGASCCDAGPRLARDSTLGLSRFPPPCPWSPRARTIPPSRSASPGSRRTRWPSGSVLELETIDYLELFVTVRLGWHTHADEMNLLLERGLFQEEVVKFG